MGARKHSRFLQETQEKDERLLATNNYNLRHVFPLLLRAFLLNLPSWRDENCSPLMRHTHSQILTDAQAALLQERRKRLGLSRSMLLQKFEAALQREGCVHSLASAKMRLDRVLNPYLRRPATEATLTALAAALSWTLLELEAALGLPSPAWTYRHERAYEVTQSESLERTVEERAGRGNGLGAAAKEGT